MPKIFQSTHPVRGATWVLMLHPGDLAISIHAPREGCDRFAPCFSTVWGISIHAPREGCDQCAVVRDQRLNISIHAPREGCDTMTSKRISLDKDFNPRTP